MRRVLQTILFSLFLAGSFQSLRAEESSEKQLEAFRKKVAEAEAALGTKNPYSGEGRASAQLQMLQMTIARGGYQNAMEMLERAVAYGIPPALQDDWLKLADQLSRDLVNRKAAEMEKLRVDVDQLVKDSRTACEEAKNSSDLDVIIVRCAALQAEREQGNTILNERISNKLNGTAKTLAAWAKYLDFRDAGNTKAANEALRSLTGSNSEFPLLSVETINARFAPNPPENVNGAAAMKQLFGGATSPDDIPKIIERLKAYLANPLNAQSNMSLQTELNRLEALEFVRSSMEKGDFDAALAGLGRFSNSGLVETQELYVPIRSQLETLVLQNQVKKWTALTLNPGEDNAGFVSRIIDELSAKGEYAKLIEVLAFSDKVNRGQPNPSGTATSSVAERTAIERFLAAQRFESAGDLVAAANNYRAVVATAGPRVPTKQAEEALKSILEKNPEIAKNTDGLVLEELRSLRQQMQMMMNRGMNGRPYP